MNIQEYKKTQAEGQPFQLPSGLVLNLRSNVSLLDLAEQGDIPLPLLATAARFISDGVGISKMDEAGLLNLGDSTKVLNLVVDACIVGNEIKASDLSFMERLLIYNKAHRIGVLRPFRPEPESNENAV